MNNVAFKVYREAIIARIRRLADPNWTPYKSLPDGTSLSPSLGISHALAQAPRRLSFEPYLESSLEEWQLKARAKLMELTGFFEERDPPTITLDKPVETIERDLVKRSFYLRVRPNTDLPVHLVYHKDLTSPAPVFLHLSGSTSGVHLAWGGTRVPIDHQRVAVGADMARQAAKRGYLAVAIEQIGYGERTEFHLPKRSANRTIDAANHLLLMGRTLMGDGASDIASTVDWLNGSGSPFMPIQDRIFLFGHSAGGTLAQFAAALDTRITGILASGSVGPIRDTIGGRGAGGGDAVVPNLLNHFETPDLIALVAPRKFVGLSGTRDHIFPFSGVEAVVTEATPFYQRLNVEANIQAVPVEGPHRYYAEASWQAWEEWMDTA